MEQIVHSFQFMAIIQRSAEVGVSAEHFRCRQATHGAVLSSTCPDPFVVQLLSFSAPSPEHRPFTCWHRHIQPRDLSASFRRDANPSPSIKHQTFTFIHWVCFAEVTTSLSLLLVLLLTVLKLLFELPRRRGGGGGTLNVPCLSCRPRAW